MRDPQQDHYRIRAQVHHDNSDTMGGVGIYLAHCAYPGTRADIHMLSQLSYNDVRDERSIYKQLPLPIRQNTRPPKGNAVSLSPSMHSAGTDGQNGWYQQLSDVSDLLFEPTGAEKAPWRQLEVTVTPKHLKATWDGQFVGELPTSTVVDRLGEVVAWRNRECPHDTILGPIPSDFPLRGSLGLFVNRGSARFRSVHIEPLTGSR